MIPLMLKLGFPKYNAIQQQLHNCPGDHRVVLMLSTPVSSQTRGTLTLKK